MNTQSQTRRRSLKEWASTPLYLLPILVPAVLITASASSPEQLSWATVASLIFVAYYVLAVDAFGQVSRSGSFQMAIAAWLFWFVRREVFIHHGEPFLGYTSMFTRAFLVLIVFALAPFYEKLWSSKASQMSVPQVAVVLFFVPYGGDWVQVAEGESTSFSIVYLAPVVKTLLLGLATFVTEAYWLHEDPEAGPKGRDETIYRYERASAPRRMLLQYASVMAMPWPLALLVAPVTLFLATVYFTKLGETSNNNNRHQASNSELSQHGIV